MRVLHLLSLAIAVCLLLSASPALAARRKLQQLSSTTDPAVAADASTAADSVSATASAATADDPTMTSTSDAPTTVPVVTSAPVDCSSDSSSVSCSSDTVSTSVSSYPAAQSGGCSSSNCSGSITVSATGSAAVAPDRMHVSMSIHKSAWASGYSARSADDAAVPLVASLSRAARSLRSVNASSAAMSATSKNISAQLESLSDSVRLWLAQHMQQGSNELADLAAQLYNSTSTLTADPTAISTTSIASNDTVSFTNLPIDATTNTTSTAAAAVTPTRAAPSSAEMASLMTALQADMTAAAAQLLSYLASSDLAAISSAPVDLASLTSGGVTLSPLYDYGCRDAAGVYDAARCDWSAPLLVGYDAWARVAVDVLLASAGSSGVLAGCLGHGATSVDQISFVAGDDALQHAEQQANAEAAQLATSKAAALAAAALSLTGDSSNSGSPSSLQLCSLVCAPRSDYAYYPMPFYTGGAQSATSTATAAASIPSSTDLVAAGLAAAKVSVKVKCTLTAKV